MLLVSEQFSQTPVADAWLEQPDQHVVDLGDVAYPPMLATAIAFAMLVVKILVMDIEQSQTETQLQRLVQLPLEGGRA